MNDVSEHGEFSEWFKPFFEVRTQSSGVAIELGVHGEKNSNTLNLIVDCDWKAVWIDASPRAIELCHEAKDVYELGGDVEIIHGALLPCGLYDGAPVEIHEYETIGHDSLLPKWKGKEPVETHSVPSLKLAKTLSDLGIVAGFELLSVDLEGYDQIVLEDFLDMSLYRPQAIVVESQALTPVFSRYMHGKGYFKLYQNDVNEFWVRETR